MHIVVSSFGTRGDIQPLIPVAQWLMSAGHDVTYATSREFVDFVEERGVAARSYGSPIRAIMESEGGRAFLESGDDIVRCLHCPMREGQSVHQLSNPVAHISTIGRAR